MCAFGLIDREELVESVATFRNTKDYDGKHVVWTNEEKETCILFSDVDPERTRLILNTVVIIEESKFSNLSDESVSRIHSNVKAAAQKIWRSFFIE